MKVSPLNNFGSFGVFIDDVDMNEMTDDQWQEIGKLFIEKLVIIFRNINITKKQFLDYNNKWGSIKGVTGAILKDRYGPTFNSQNPDTWFNVSQEDKDYLLSRQHWAEYLEEGGFLTRVYGGKDQNGNALGIFDSGDLNWHSNEVANLTFSPAVSLLGNQFMKDSSTGFLQTVDLYESLPESFRSELDEMVVIHRFIPGITNEREYTDKTIAKQTRMNFCPIDNLETPLICTAPNGRKGFHYTLNTRAQIRGLSVDESQKIFSMLDRLIFDDRWTYDHWYQSDNTLCVFDNSVTMHRRLGGHPERKAFRIQWDISPLVENAWLPWHHNKEFNEQYIKDVHKLVNLIGGDLKKTFKFPHIN